MSTSEYGSVDAESELPISATELAALATQLYAASIRPGPDSPPQAVPVAPRGSVPDATAATSVADPYLPPGDFSAFAVPSQGIVPTVPGVLATAAPTVPVAPRGSAPYSGIGWLPEAPSIPDLGWSGTVPVVPNAPAGDDHHYYFLTDTDPVPQLADDHEIFDVDAVRADFPILKETVNGKPLIWLTTRRPPRSRRW